jgi:hypothetical protein
VETGRPAIPKAARGTLAVTPQSVLGPVLLGGRIAHRLNAAPRIAALLPRLLRRRSGQRDRLRRPRYRSAIEPMGGAIARVPETATAFQHRRPSFSLLIALRWPHEVSIWRAARPATVLGVPSVGFSRKNEEWVVRGEERRSGSSGELLLVQEDLPLISAADLKRALSAHEQYYDGHSVSYARVSVLPEAHFDADGPVEPICFELVHNELIVTIDCLASWPDDDNEDTAVAQVTRLVVPHLRHTRSSLHGIQVNDSMTDPFYLMLEVGVAMPWRGRSVGDLYQRAEDIRQLCETLATGDVSHETVANLIRGGGAHLLIDQREGNWLDAKSEEYDLTTTHGKISLAQAIAKFANAEDGGLIIVGAKAKKIPGGEVIRQVRGVVLRQTDTSARYLRALDQHLYPPVLGLRIDIVATADDRSLIAIDIPLQPEELKPFLVHGAITAEGDTEGSFISIVQRRGEGSIAITAPMIHASIAAGRALLRGQRQPDVHHNR